MSDLRIRKQALQLEELFHDGGPANGLPQRKLAMVTVIANPFAGRYEPDILPFVETLKPLGRAMAQRMVDMLGGDPAQVQGYGKGAIAGENGELEHAALWHEPGGWGMREVLGTARAIVPSTKKLGGAGTRLDVPVTHINASYVRSHYDAMEVGLNDAPRANELALMLVMTTGPRPHARVGGLRVQDISAHDGLR
ncbi:amino acid synthesis family protein [Rhodobacteraceae bacterium 2376]|uniref:Amino acid synthesis family protein n=1 Tax=Rhabdonatronobacter sediminivivens TaxID=2743469 RepID=A0A7Z0HWW9_9RHOB|nr:amino acid synthesis family protein [Rhabdonatronobacter sediminivivens]NYS23814.1 amino acid synthesis family protein [Rhabdonatronobacter sediminivivens]